MKRPGGGALIVAVALGLAACGGATLPEVAAPDVERVAPRYPGTDLATLARGRDLYRRRCSACHRPVAPASVSHERWPSIVASMRERAGVSVEDARAIERYVVAISIRVVK